MSKKAWILTGAVLLLLCAAVVIPCGQTYRRNPGDASDGSDPGER